MKRSICGHVLLALLGFSLLASPALAGDIVVYFDAAGTQRDMDSPGIGAITSVWVFGENFEAPFISGIQYKVDYGPNLVWLGDVETPGTGGNPGTTVGTSATGIAMSFGALPRPGGKFVCHKAFVVWTADCSSGSNVDGPTVGAHPILGPEAATRFPDFALLDASGQRSQTCQFVELDIKPSGNCPSPLNVKLWLDPDGLMDKGGKVKVAVIGDPSTGVDPSLIDPSSCRLGGAAADPGWKLADVSTATGVAGCDGGKSKKDGVLDLLLEFRASDVIAGLPVPSPGDLVDLTLTGCYIDGLPFSATDQVRVVGNIPNKLELIQDTDDGALSFPNPNPFNPVTRITYRIPQTQHVRLAIFDVSGRLVDELVNEVKGAGKYVVEWDAGTHPSGVYFYRLETGGKTLVRRATLLK